MDPSKPAPSPVRVAVEGCGHGCLNDIYASIESAAALKGWDGVDLVIIGGDFQAARNSNDIACMSVPQKFKAIGDFHEYYSGTRTAPYLTIFVGGNHEASNYLFELYYGGWVAPNIYYLGAANVIRYGPLRIAGMSGIFKGYDYRKAHHERLPYNRDDIQSIYHVRELDVRKLLQIRTQVDVGLSHDWPRQVEYAGDYETLFKVKKGLRDDSVQGRFGSRAAKHVFDRLRPAYWFASHMHVKFAAAVQHGEYALAGPYEQKENAPESHTSQSSQVRHALGLDGAVMASLVSGDEELAHDSSVPEQMAAESSALSAAVPSNLTDNNTPDESVHGQSKKDTVTSEETDVAAPDDPTPSASGDPEVRWPGPAMNDLGDPQNRLSAWNNFHTEATRRERAENAQFLAERSDPGPLPEFQHNLTWKRVNIDQDGLNRTVTSTERPDSDGNPEHKKQKTQHKADSVKNEDEIDLDADSSSDHGSPPEEAARTENMSKKGISDAPTAGAKCAGGEEDSEQVEHPVAPADVSETLRSQLPASFARPEPPARPVNGPLPEAISNTTTHFLALDKCLPNRDFLQLVELQPISEGEVGFERPYRLQYDKEWLAISRAFSNDLQLGNPNAKPPQDKGDVIYRPEIEKEEQWIEENVVQPGKLVVPDNFTPTAPFYDPAVPITTEQQPPEYTNPQTAQFCELIGIDNKFHLSDEERQARMTAGPRPNDSRSGGPAFFQRRGAGNRRGGGHGQRGRGRGGGRGRGQNTPRY